MISTAGDWQHNSKESQLFAHVFCMYNTQVHRLCLYDTDKGRSPAHCITTL